MLRARFTAFLSTSLSALFLLGTASAQDVRTKDLTARVGIQDGVATTTITQVLVNDSALQAEATWILPLGEGAVADQFKMTANGVEMASEVLGADQARSVYEGIVRAKRDPALLEYFGKGCLRARVFPIPAKGSVSVNVRFRQVLPRTGALFEWRLPVRVIGVAGRAPDSIVLDLELSSRNRIGNVFSPSHDVHVVQKDDHHARASFEGSPARLENGEPALFYGLAEGEFGLDLLSHWKKGEQEGTFLMLVSPRRDWDEERILSKAITFVVDVSGSMAGKKIEQAKGALRYFLGSLRPADRFQVIAFSTDVQPFFAGLVEATGENLAQAQAKIERLEALGGTNISDSLHAALGSAVPEGAVPILVFLTDGLPTLGERTPQCILQRVRQENAAKARIFVFGVGSDVDTVLLDSLAAESGGARDYVREEEDIEIKTGALFTKLSHPVLSEVELAVEGIELSQLAPKKLPDLFRGDRLVFCGRYAGSGPRAIRLSGAVNGAKRTYAYEGTFAGEGGETSDFVPALWAERRVAYLLDEIRRNGSAPELVAEIERLGREYHVVTPYTSHLIVEEGLRLGFYRGPSDGAPPWPVGGGGFGARYSGPASPGTPSAEELDQLRALGYVGDSAPSGSDSFFMGRGAAKDTDQARLAVVVERLREAGVLPRDAAPEELKRLTDEVARELRESEVLRMGFAEKTGAAAVDTSVYLSRLMAGEARTQDQLLALFSRRVKDKVFFLRDGVWTDRAFDPAKFPAPTVVEAYSNAYFDLLRVRPELAPYFAFSPRIVVVLGDQAFEVREPAARAR